MYSLDERTKAVQLYIESGYSKSTVIRTLGYPPLVLSGHGIRSIFAQENFMLPVYQNRVTQKLKNSLHAYAVLTVHDDRTAWCIAAGEMVHCHRSGGAWWPGGLVHGHHAGVLLNHALAFSHGLAFNLNGTCIINDSVTDGIGQI